MGICYNTIYNTSTSAFEKHGTAVSVTGIHDCGYYVINDPTINAELNTSADSQYGVTSANTDLNTVVIESEQDTSGTPSVSATINQEVIEMKVELQITAISPSIITVYAPLPKTLPDAVVKR